MLKPSQHYGNVRTVSSPNHTFFLGKLDYVVNHYFVHILSLVTDNNPSWISRREENGRRNYFMINLRESMGPGPDQTRNPWICSQTCYGLCYAARSCSLLRTSFSLLYFFSSIYYAMESNINVYACNALQWRHNIHVAVMAILIAETNKTIGAEITQEKLQNISRLIGHSESTYFVTYFKKKLYEI